MTYNELLRQKEWWSMCNKILSRDHFLCKDCGRIGFHNGGNYMILSRMAELDALFMGWTFKNMAFSKFWSNIPYTEPHQFRNIIFQTKHNDNGINVYDLNLFESKNYLFYDIYSIPEKLIIISKETLNSLDAKVYEFGEISKKNNSLDTGWAYLFEFPCVISNEIYVNIEYSLPSIIDHVPSERIIINITFENRLLSLRYNPYSFRMKGLNIHHTYYTMGCKPWEYEEVSLVTLCEDCHKKRHETTCIPLYDKNDRLISNLISCDRCGGSGYLPQYSYVEHGICFKCCGEGVILDD